MSCKHIYTHYEDWPDGGSIEVCDNCRMSRHHWEQGETNWIMVKDIEEARKRIQNSIDHITGEVYEKDEKEAK